MSKKTITARVRGAKTLEGQKALVFRWLDSWEQEQRLLCDKLSVAAEINDFDILCIANGQLREVTKKKFDAFYNILKVVNLPEQAKDGGIIYEWGKYQTALVAIVGRKISENDLEEVVSISQKLDDINNTKFNLSKKIIENLS